MLLGIYLINHEHDRLSRFAQHSPHFLIERRQAFLRVHDKKENVALAQRFIRSAANLLCQLSFASPKDAAGVPQCEGALTPGADCRKPVACDPRLPVDDRNLSANEAIEQRGLTYVRPPDDYDV